MLLDGDRHVSQRQRENEMTAFTVYTLCSFLT